MSDKSPIIEVQLELPATAKDAFHAWTDASVAEKWWGGWAEGTAPEMQFESRVGGPWRFAMCFDGKTQWVSGEVLELDAPRMVRFSFSWEGQSEAPTPVLLAFEDLPGGRVRLTLTHDQSTGGNACAEGWTWSLGCLRDYLVAQLEPDSPKLASKPT